MSDKHIMLDLETAGTTPYSAILSIGAVSFDPDAYQLGKSFYTNIDFNSCLDAGLTYSKKTLEWWENQNADAFNALLIDQKPLVEALQAFTDFCGGISKNPIVWGNGSNFDNVLITCAYERVGLTRPWNYRNDNDMRTIVKLTNGYLDRFDEKHTGILHNALDDAITQAKCVMKMHKAIRQSLKFYFDSANTIVNNMQQINTEQKNESHSIQ